MLFRFTKNYLLSTKQTALSVFFSLLTVVCFAQNDTDSLIKSNNADSLFTQAQIALTMNGNLVEATRLFKSVIAVQPDNAQAYAQLSAIYQQNSAYSSALTEIKKAASLDKTNADYQNQLAVLLTQTGKYTEAATVFAQLAKTSADSSDYLAKEAFCYELAKEYQKSLSILSKLAPNTKQGREALLKAKLKLYARLENIDSVISITHQMIRLYPDNPDNYVMASATEDISHKGTDAVRTIDSALKRFPNDQHVVNQAVLLYVKYDHKKLQNYYDQLLKNRDTSMSALEKMRHFAPLAVLSSKDTFAKRVLNETLPSLAFGPPQNQYAINLYAAVLDGEKRYKEAVAVSQRGIAEEPKNVILWNSLLNSYNLMNNPDSLKFYSAIAMTKFPKHRFPLYYNALSNYAKGDTTATIIALETAKIHPTVDSLIPDFTIYSFLGDLYQSQGRQDSAYNNYKAALNIYPNSVLVLNNYSYALAENNNDLDSALSMSAKTLEDNPDEPMYLDTYGWILYKQKKYTEAKKYIEQALKNLAKPDATIQEHLGDVEYALGNRKQAKKNWKKAVRLGNDSKELREKLER